MVLSSRLGLGPGLAKCARARFFWSSLPVVTPLEIPLTCEAVLSEKSN